MIQFSGRPGIHQGPRNDIFVFVLHMPSFELDFDVQKCTNLYIFNKTQIAGKRLRRMSHKLAFIISASTYIPRYSSRKVSQPWQISNTSKYFTKMLHFYLQSSLLFENGYEEFPINWHSGSSLLHRPTFQRTTPGTFSTMSNIEYK